MFPSYYVSRTLLIAAAVSALTSVSTTPLMAAGHIQVEGDKIGDVRALDDAARPASGAKLHVTFALNSDQLSSISTYVNSLNDPTSPNYHKWLTPAEFGQKFGASDTQIGNVESYLVSNKFSNIKLYKNRLFVTADTVRTEAEKTLGVTIHGYDRSPDLIAEGYSTTYYAPSTEPTVPSNLANDVRGIFGLSNEVQHISNFKRLRRVPDAATLAAGPGLTPAALAAQYDITTLHDDGLYGQGETIAIYSPTTYTASDITAFFTAEDITPPTINIINVNGGATGPLSSDEACADIEIIGSQANKATVDVYEGPNDTSFDIFNDIAENDNAQILSESYGTDEITQTQAYADSYDIVRSEIVAEGTSIFVASGDAGAYNADYPNPATPSVSVDASSQYVTAVGGTEISGAGEVAWTFNDQPTTLPNTGSNGGLSIFYPIPTWQAGYGVYESGISNGMRQVPDVAALAGLPGYLIYSDGSLGTFVGTSGAAPLWAASMALIDEGLGGAGLGNVNQSIYGAAETASSAFNDILTGNNGVYFAGPGWDFVTGWGSADFGTLFTALSGGAVTTRETSGVHAYGTGLQLIAVPYSYPDTSLDIQQVLSGLVTPDGDGAFEVAVWDPSGETYTLTPLAPANVPVPGVGYWARFNSTFGGGELTVLGTPISALSYAIPIQAGWNQIGDPFTSTTSLPIASSLQFTYGAVTESFDAAVASNWLAPTIYAYDTATNAYTDLSSTDSLAPWTGYWIYSAVDGELTFLAPSP